MKVFWRLWEPLALAAVAVAATDPRAELAKARNEASAAARPFGAARYAGARRDRRGGQGARAEAAVAARIQASEADIAAAEARIAILERLQRAQEQRLAAHQQPIVKLIAALQTMARRPAAAALVQPGTVADLVHVRAVLSTMAPRVATATAGVRDEVTRAQAIQREAATGAWPRCARARPRAGSSSNGSSRWKRNSGAARCRWRRPRDWRRSGRWCSARMPATLRSWSRGWVRKGACAVASPRCRGRCRVPGT